MPKDKQEPAAGVGDNAPISLHDWAAIRHRQAQIREQIKEWQGKMRKLRGEIKAKDILLADWDAWERLSKLDASARGKHTSIMELFDRYAGIEPGSQVEMDLNTSDEEREERILAKAAHEGLMAGVDGVLNEDDNPHDPTMPAGQKWLEKYREGQQIAARNLGELDAAMEGRDDDGMTDRDFDDDDFGDEEPDDDEDDVKEPVSEDA